MVKIYYATIDGVRVDGNLINTLPRLRRDYVLSIKDDLRRKQSVFVWKLLENVLKNNFGLISGYDFTENNGEWSLENSKLKFSLSHSKEIVAVAVCDGPVGVDVELCSNKILKLKSMFPSDASCEDEIERLAILWTQRESAYKAKINGKFFTKNITFNNEKYVVCVCSAQEDAEFMYIDMQNLLKGDSR